MRDTALLHRLLPALVVLGGAPALAQEEIGERERKRIPIEWAEPLATKHYEVEYEKALAASVVNKVASAMEEALEQYIVVFKFQPQEKLKVKYLENLNTYEQEGGDPSHPGHYNPGSKYLVLLDKPFYQLIPTAYHEAFHQYLGAYIGDGVQIPTWFNEGMAMYFEGMQTSKKTKKLDFREIDNRKIGMVQRSLQTRTAIPLEKLVNASHQEFHDKKKESLHYTQSLAFIYFLMQAKGGKPVFQFAEELKSSKDAALAAEKIFGKESKNLKKTEQQWKAYTLQLKLTAPARA